MIKTWCVGGRQYSTTINQNVYEKFNRLTKKLVRIINGSCSICGHNKSQILTR